MSSLESAQIRQALAKGVVRFVMEDTAIGLRLQYVGSGSVTTVAATQATSVVLTTSDGGTDTYLFSSYSTLGALADAINADGIFEAVVIDALRSENPDDFFITSASIAAGNRWQWSYLLRFVNRYKRFIDTKCLSVTSQSSIRHAERPSS